MTLVCCGMCDGVNDICGPDQYMNQVTVTVEGLQSADHDRVDQESYGAHMILPSDSEEMTQAKLESNRVAREAAIARIEARSPKVRVLPQSVDGQKN